MVRNSEEIGLNTTRSGRERGRQGSREGGREGIKRFNSQASKLGSSEGATGNGPLVTDGPDIGRVSLKLSQLLDTRLDKITRPEQSWFLKFFKVTPNIMKLT